MRIHFGLVCVLIASLADLGGALSLDPGKKSPHPSARPNENAREKRLCFE